MDTSSRRSRSRFVDTETRPPLPTPPPPPPPAVKSRQRRRSPAAPKTSGSSLVRCFLSPFRSRRRHRVGGNDGGVSNQRGRVDEAKPSTSETSAAIAVGGEREERKEIGHSTSPEDYRLLEEIGSGGSATVYRAIYLPSNEIVAVKCLDLDRCNIDLDDIRREAQTMTLLDHPNLLKAYCSFVVDHFLWVVTPFMAEGSCLHLMKFAYPDGFEERVIASTLKETLKALDYLHKHGHIHRDVKAGNILIDGSGAVKLADFGVSAFMFDDGDRKRSRNTFKGTPCWMAPEVMQPGSGYDFKADIWSFGITALELAHGHAPFSKYPPMKVLLMTLQNAPPGLDYDRDKKFSKSFKEMIAMCLVKDQTKRPPADKLLKHSFFKSATPPELSMKSIFANLPPLWSRVKELQMKDAAQLALKNMPSSEQEARSQSEYQRGVSAWNFDIEDLKEQASLIRDDGEVSEVKEDEEIVKASVSPKEPSTFISSPGKFRVNGEIHSVGNISERNESAAIWSSTKNEKHQINAQPFNNQGDVKKCEDQIFQNDLAPSTSNRSLELNQLNVDGVKEERSASLEMPLTLQRIPFAGKMIERFEGDDRQAVGKFKSDTKGTPNLSGLLMLPNRASANSLSAPTPSSGNQVEPFEDKLKPNVQIKGRFSVTSENMDLVKDVPLLTVPNKSPQRPPLRKSGSLGDELIQSKTMPNGHLVKDSKNSALPASVFISHLQNLLHQKSIQQNLIVNILTSLQQNDQVDAIQGAVQNKDYNIPLETANSEREHSLLTEISELHSRMVNLTDELTAEKLKHVQLQQQLNALEKQEMTNK